MKHLKKLEENGREVRQRRAFTDEELAKLLALPSPYRIVYLMAVYTGLRRAELENLRWSDLHLEIERPYVQVRAAISKNKKNAFLPLHPELVEELKKFKQSSTSKSEKIFMGLVPSMPHFQKDLAKAGITYKDELGRQADFHALRKTLATNLNKMGVAPRVAMELMRHSDMKLTMQNYTDSSQLPTFSAIQQLPWASGSNSTNSPSMDTDTQIDTLNLDANRRRLAQAVQLAKKRFSSEVLDNQGFSHKKTQTGASGQTDNLAPLSRHVTNFLLS